MDVDNRKIATILAADVVGYSRLMERDDEATLATLKNCRNIFNRLVAEYGGREFGSVGDSFMAQFPSAVNAVRGAMAIQDGMVELNTSDPGGLQMSLRMGLNLGDVIEEEGTLYGDGVNVAARVQQFASPGSILITSSVYEQVENRLPASFQYSGQRQVKNISHPVQMYQVLPGETPRYIRLISTLRRWLTSHTGLAVLAAIVITVIVVVLTKPRVNEQPPGKNYTNQIAVLPFENMSDDSANVWLGQGISEDILNLLAQIKDIKVVARTSSFQKDLQSMDVRDIGQQLNVRYILEGSVRRSGERIRIVAQLNDTKTGYHVWSQEYNRSTSDVFAIQGEIADRVVKALKLALPVDFAKDTEIRPTNNIDAYDYYLQARNFLEQPTVQSLQDAVQFFRRALDFDPEFGLAYAGLCTALVKQIERQQDLDALQLAEQACANGRKYSADSPQVHAAMGDLYQLKGDNEAALKEYQLVVNNTSDNLDARLGIARVQAGAGNIDAADQSFRDAIQMGPDYGPAYAAYGKFLFNHGRTTDAIRIYQRLTELEPSNVAAYISLGGAYQFAGNFEESAAANREVISRQPNEFAYTNIGTNYYYLGRYEDAAVMQRQAIELSPEDYSLWGNLADTLLQLPDQQEQARDAYRHARKLAEQSLAVNPKQGLVLAFCAYYCVRLEEIDCANSSIKQALQLSDSNPYTYYNAALVSLILGNKEQAIVQINRAAQLGFPTVLLNAEPLLAPLRDKGRLMAAGPERDKIKRSNR